MRFSTGTFTRQVPELPRVGDSQKAPLCDGAGPGAISRRISSKTRVGFLRIHSPSGDAFGSPALSISAPIFLETLGASPVVCGDGMPGVSVAASGTVAIAGLFGIEFRNSGGALLESCDKWLWADATPTIASNAPATYSECVFIGLIS
jgi:hypothetical protein